MMHRFPTSRPSAVAGLLLALLLAGCASRTPAPIEHRGAGARPQDVRTARPAATPAPGTRPVAPPVAATADPATPPGVQTAPVRSGAVESRPLDSRPPDAGRPASTASAARSQPKGLKRPYSDSTYAEVARADPVRPEERKGASAPAPAVAQASTPSAATPSVGAPPATPATPAPDAPSVTEATASDWMWPASGKVVQAFDGGRNKGIAIAARAGEAVAAAADGKVIFSGVVRGYGNLVIVKHGADLLSVYAHNRSLSVKEGETVRRGQKIAEVGDTDTDRVKLHFEVRRQGRPIDPLKMLPPR